MAARVACLIWRRSGRCCRRELTTSITRSIFSGEGCEAFEPRSAARALIFSELREYHLLERLEHLPVTLADGRLLIDMKVRPTEHAAGAGFAVSWLSGDVGSVCKSLRSVWAWRA